MPRTTGGSPQKYCSVCCRHAYTTAARRWVECGLDRKWLTVDQLKRLQPPSALARALVRKG